MKINWRFFLSFFSLYLGLGLTLHAVENPQLNNPEILEPKYIQIEVSNTSAVKLSVLSAFQNITEIVQTKYYSLLNWKLRTRSTQLEVPNYNRLEQFGTWINDPNDQVCYNTRAKVLVRDSKKEVIFKDSNHCVVEQGSWDDPYTNSELNFAHEVQIDHLVPLKNAYVSGAHKWNFKARCLFANYLGYDYHLLSVNGIQNMKKGDKAPDKYLPPHSDYNCTYIRNWLAVKMLWGLSMTLSEAQAIQQDMLQQNCSLAPFRMSEAEMMRQKKFAQDNIDLCEKIDKSGMNP